MKTWLGIQSQRTQISLWVVRKMGSGSSRNEGLKTRGIEGKVDIMIFARKLWREG